MSCRSPGPLGGDGLRAIRTRPCRALMGRASRLAATLACPSTRTQNRNGRHETVKRDDSPCTAPSPRGARVLRPTRPLVARPSPDPLQPPARCSRRHPKITELALDAVLPADARRRSDPIGRPRSSMTRTRTQSRARRPARQAPPSHTKQPRAICGSAAPEHGATWPREAPPVARLPGQGALRQRPHVVPYLGPDLAHRHAQRSGGAWYRGSPRRHRCRAAAAPDPRPGTSGSATSAATRPPNAANKPLRGTPRGELLQACPCMRSHISRGQANSESTVGLAVSGSNTCCSPGSQGRHTAVSGGRDSSDARDRRPERTPGQVRAGPNPHPWTSTGSKCPSPPDP